MDEEKNMQKETAVTVQEDQPSAAAKSGCAPAGGRSGTERMIEKKRKPEKIKYLYLCLVIFLAAFVVFTALDASVLKWPCMTKTVDEYGWSAAPLGAFLDLFYYVPFRLWTFFLDSRGGLE